MELNESEKVMRVTYRHCNRIVEDCIDELARLNGTCPEALSVSGEGWDKAEDAIGQAAHDDRYNDTTKLCDAYTERVVKYCQAWVDRYLKPPLPNRNKGSNLTAF